MTPGVREMADELNRHRPLDHRRLPDVLAAFRRSDGTLDEQAMRDELAARGLDQVARNAEQRAAAARPAPRPAPAKCCPAHASARNRTERRAAGRTCPCRADCQHCRAVRAR